MRDPYSVLGVARDATEKEIKSAFRKLAKRYHPDHNRDDPDAQAKFAEIGRAYEILGDAKKRAAFDRGEIDAEGKERFHGFDGGAGAGADPFAAFRRGGPGGARFEFHTTGPGADIFSEIFGHGFGAGRTSARTAPAGEDIAATLEVSLEEAACGARVTATFPGGRRLAVQLPAYVEDGQVIRLKGQGAPSLFGGPPGDALVTLRLKPHPRFRVEGRDLHADLPVDLADAVLGARVPFETLSGRVAVNVPAWSDSGKQFRLKGKGLPKRGGGRGDLYLHLQIRLPHGDAELESLMRRRRG